MKNPYNNRIVVALATSMLVLSSCSTDVSKDIASDGIHKKTFRASVPSIETGAQTRTGVDAEGLKSYWLPGDIIGVVNNVTDRQSTIYEFVNDGSECSNETTFTGEIPESEEFYAFYPVDKNSSLGTAIWSGSAYQAIASKQVPTASSFDPKADLMVSEPFTADEPYKVPAELHFYRTCAILHVMPSVTDESLAGETVCKVRVESSSANLTGGYVMTNLKTCDVTPAMAYSTIMPLFHYVEADCSGEAAFTLGSGKGVMVTTYATKLPAGSTLTVTAWTTAGTKLERSVTVDKDIDLLPNEIRLVKAAYTEADRSGDPTILMEWPAEGDTLFFTSEGGTADIQFSTKYLSNHHAYAYLSGINGSGMYYSLSSEHNDIDNGHVTLTSRPNKGEDVLEADVILYIDDEWGYYPKRWLASKTIHVVTDIEHVDGGHTIEDPENGVDITF